MGAFSKSASMKGSTEERALTILILSIVMGVVFVFKRNIARKTMIISYINCVKSGEQSRSNNHLHTKKLSKNTKQELILNSRL